MTAPRQPSNQELRTRKDLLLAASRLLQQGRKPTMDDVAKEALVSRPTAYRYFRSIEALLAEAPIEAAVADPAEMLTNHASSDPESRIDAAEAAMHRVVYQNEAHLRIVLANSIGRDLSDETLPKRQNRRMPLIQAALAPARARFRDEEYRKLCAALAMLFGPESMIVARDVLAIDEPSAREVKSWAVRALVRAALEPAKTPPRRKPG